MSKKNIILGTLIVILLSNIAMAEEKASQANLVIKLIFPAASGAAMKSPGPILEPQELSGQVLIDIQPKPSNVEKDRYLVEYFLDEDLIYETTGFDEQEPSRFTFRYLLDTTKYENGNHKLIINFWDREGKSAIGVREVVINNKLGE